MTVEWVQTCFPTSSPTAICNRERGRAEDTYNIIHLFIHLFIYLFVVLYTFCRITIRDTWWVSHIYLYIVIVPVDDGACVHSMSRYFWYLWRTAQSTIDEEFGATRTPPAVRRKRPMSPYTNGNIQNQLINLIVIFVSLPGSVPWYFPTHLNGLGEANSPPFIYDESRASLENPWYKPDFVTVCLCFRSSNVIQKVKLKKNWIS